MGIENPFFTDSNSVPFNTGRTYPYIYLNILSKQIRIKKFASAIGEYSEICSGPTLWDASSMPEYSNKGLEESLSKVSMIY